MKRSAELRQYIDIIGNPLGLVYAAGEICQRLVSVCYQFDEVAVIQTALVISIDVLEAEYLGVSLVLVPVTLRVEVSV